MNSRIIFIGAAILSVLGLYFLGKTTPPVKPIPAAQAKTKNSFDIQAFIAELEKGLSPTQNLYLSKLKESVVRGDVKTQQLSALEGLAAFWKDSVPRIEPYAYYLSEAAVLVNSEKNLTFAAQLMLEDLRGEQDPAKLDWKTAQAIGLFEKAILLNPENDDLRIGLGSCYIFGRGRSGDPAETMKGIQELLAVARKDSTNMKAQLMLGVGGYVSGQYDKAVERLKKVVDKEPGNLEAIAFLADTYAAKGDKQAAIEWYTLSKRLVNNPHYTEEVDRRIEELK